LCENGKITEKKPFSLLLFRKPPGEAGGGELEAIGEVDELFGEEGVDRGDFGEESFDRGDFGELEELQAI
jgi:hypothetical protein